MKIKSIRLQSFRNHSDSTLNLEGTSLCLIRGANASGKSSIAQAISINMTNTTMGLPGDGKGYQSKVKEGTGKAVVTAEIQGQHLLLNVVTMSLNTSGRTVSVECLDDPDNNKIVNGFGNFLKDRKSALLIACNTDHFSRLSEKEQTDLLAKLVLPSHYDFPQEKTEAVNALLSEPINFDGDPFDVITNAYKKLYKEREVANRQCKEFVVPDALPKPKDVDSESLQVKLNGVREQRSKLQAERDAAVATANKIEVERGKLETTIANLQAKVKAGREKLTKLSEDILPDEGVEALKHVASRLEHLDKLKSDHTGLLGGVRTLNQQIGRLKDISEQGATCPTCDQEIDSAKIAGLVADLEKEIVTADARLQELDKQIDAIGDVKGAVESIRKHDAAVEEKRKLETELSATVQTGKDTRTALNALGEAVNATLPFNDPLAALQAEEDKINEQLRPVIAAEEREAERKRLTAQLEKLEKKAATVDMLVKYFDKDGVKKTLISQYIGSFESKFNPVMDAFGYKASLSFDPIGFDITTKRGYVGPVKEISGAEEHIFKAAFQCAVSIAAGINLVVIDEVEELGEDIRNLLYGGVYGLINDGLLEQAIMIQYSLDKTVPAPNKRAPGSKYFYVTDGTVEELR